MQANQPGGFDCPGCAWGDSAGAGKIDFCENGVKAIAWEATSKRVDEKFFNQYSISALQQWDDHSLESSGRLTEPMLYDGSSDHYRPISWQQAFAVIANNLQQLETPDQALLYTSGRASNEAAYLYQLFGRVFGTNNFPDCSNMCHEASGVGMTRGIGIGIGKGTVTIEDFKLADAIFVFGQNPGTNHPRMLATLRKASKRGANVVAVNNLKEQGLQKFADPQSPKEMILFSSTNISQHYFTPRLGGDMAILRGMAKSIFAKAQQDDTVLDHQFIAEHCHGFDQYRDSVATVQEPLNVLLLRGNIGKPGAGACPVRGHSNVQGNRTVGIDEQPSAKSRFKYRGLNSCNDPRKCQSIYWPRR
ncbi:molybdopterin-dependent oxidoreductase [Thalassotalea sp. ND16A]|uniref:molybdopterin-dependent oxidoreductase n=1 Tax=Thalassotalea sp. ND16A TaxID=1535422 RepID=UPI00051CD549|nr:hypothetical protein ND16A_2208 [Thalassotalea sp. ND16A]